jgi:hypothetical protein
VRREHAAWTLIYPNVKVRLEKWSGSWALLMPHFSTVFDEQKDLFKDDLKMLLLKAFDNQCKVHTDVKWRNIGYYWDLDGKKMPIVFDLDAVVDFIEDKHMNWVDTAMKTLYPSLQLSP